MAGIYFHIPFCKQACHYCDFHFSTSLKYKTEMVYALQKEVILRKQYLLNQRIETIYFGGGTPSLLNGYELEKLLETVYRNFEVATDVEITLEANPDDLDRAKIKDLKSTSINRFSIGVQSFYDEDLAWMNRAHVASQAESAIKGAQDAGFTNITIDLIYGYPLLSTEKWQNNINAAISFDVPHISAYALTVEPKTALDTFIKRKIQSPISSEQSVNHFKLLIDQLETASYEHYEISNFAFSGKRSKHNTNYWKGVKYLGIGPSAHSFNGSERQWNLANNAVYLDSILKGKLCYEKELLSTKDKANEYIMTALRTSDGVSILKIEALLNDKLVNQFKKQLNYHVDKGNIILKDKVAVLSLNGKFFADSISSDLFVLD